MAASSASVRAGRAGSSEGPPSDVAASAASCCSTICSADSSAASDHCPDDPDADVDGASRSSLVTSGVSGVDAHIAAAITARIGGGSSGARSAVLKRAAFAPLAARSFLAVIMYIRSFSSGVLQVDSSSSVLLQAREIVLRWNPSVAQRLNRQTLAVFRARRTSRLSPPHTCCDHT